MQNSLCKLLFIVILLLLVNPVPLSLISCFASLYLSLIKLFKFELLHSI